jgi:hypothetical protein
MIELKILYNDKRGGGRGASGINRTVMTSHTIADIF